MYERREPPDEPPCITCRVDLLDENAETAQVYMLTRRQVITVGQGDVADISIPAVKIAMDLYGVREQKNCLNRVRRLFHYFREKKHEGQ